MLIFDMSVVVIKSSGVFSRILPDVSEESFITFFKISYKSYGEVTVKLLSYGDSLLNTLN